MCPLWPFHYLIIYLVLFSSLFYFVVVSSASTKSWNVTFTPAQILRTHISEVTKVHFNVTEFDDNTRTSIVSVICPDILQCTPSYITVPRTSKQFSSSFNVTPTFMGAVNVKLRLLSEETNETIKESNSQLPVTVIRKTRVIDHVFTASVAVLVSIIFINFGCALDLNMVKENFTKPVAPIIGMVCQFLFMPLIGFAIGKLIFPDSVPMQLGLFFTGVSPSGGASNIWICMLGGNLNLSITITSISNLCAFFVIPLWTFTLGRIIFDKGAMVVPYTQIATYAVSLLPPLMIGLLLQKKCPKFSKLMVRILKPFSSCLILFIIVFASITNFYLFKLFTWQILLAGLCLPLFGYILAWLVAAYFQRSYEDRLAISIETGVQNTGIAIFMLRFSLGQPEADLTTVVPVAVALMTPVPIMLLYFASKFTNRSKTLQQEKNDSALTYPVEDRVSAVSLINNVSPE